MIMRLSGIANRLGHAVRFTIINNRETVEIDENEASLMREVRDIHQDYIEWFVQKMNQSMRKWDRNRKYMVIEKIRAIRMPE